MFLIEKYYELLYKYILYALQMYKCVALFSNIT